MQPALDSWRKVLMTAVMVLTIAGIVVSAVSLYNHYSTSKSNYCDFGENFNCDIVNRSIYSMILGVPVALIGVLGYCALLGLAIVARRKKDEGKLLLITSLLGLGLALYLTYVEKFILAVWCILCLSSLGVILAITILSAVLVITQSRQA